MSEIDELAKLRADVNELQVTLVSLIHATSGGALVRPTPERLSSFLAAHDAAPKPGAGNADSETTDEFGDPSGATYRKIDGRVVLGGRVTGGNSSLIFMLPEGFRPSKEQTFSAQRDNGAVVTVTVLPDGSLLTELGEGAVVLAGITFSTT